VSHSADPTNHWQDRGFSLVEILVAIGVLTTVMVALLPQLIVGIRSTGTARLVTQAKGVAQGQLEQMRAMPFYLSKSTNGVDVLDTYFPKRTETSPVPTCDTGGRLNEPQTTWSGYVAPTATRCSYEPAGAFYRHVRSAITGPNMGRFVVVTATQFLSADLPRTVVTPGSDYDSAVKDEPPATQIGVTISVLRSDRGTWRPVTTYTQIQQGENSDSRVRAEASVKAVEVSSVTTDAGPLSFVAGQLDLLGTMSSAVTTSANLAATTAGLSSGVQASGASTAVLAPPAVSATATTRPAGSLPAGAFPLGSCGYACWGTTYVGPVSATVENSLPRAGTPTAPLQAMITDLANGGFKVGNSTPDKYVPSLGLTAETPTGALVQLDATEPPDPSGIADCKVAEGGSDLSYVTASGYLLTNPANDPTAPYRVESCAVARTTAVSILPTLFAPRGVIRIELTRASARCRLDGTGHVPSTSHEFEAVVQYWNGTSYVEAAKIVPNATTDPLLGVPLSTPVGLGHTLGDYIASWASLTQDKVASTATTGAVSVDLPGVVTIATQPVRGDAAGTTDPTSGVSIAIGAIGCSVEDLR
jgi:prepilin-type N-terminal cleavage/methylation domain-containing protein